MSFIDGIKEAFIDGIKEEIDYIIKEEERKKQRNQRIQRARRTANFRKPTYFSVYAAKFMIWSGLGMKKAEIKRAPMVPPPKSKEDFKLLFQFIREDLTGVWRRILPPKKGLPGSNESWKDWEDQI